MIHIRRLVWDGWNIDHIARHDVTPEEAEEVCHSDLLLLKGKKGRLVVVGFTQKGRMVSVVLDPEPEAGVYYPVTARPAAKKERRLYQEWKEGVKT